MNENQNNYWYKPLYAAPAANPAPAAPAVQPAQPEETHKPFYKRPIFYILIAAALLALFISLVVILVKHSGITGIYGGTAETPEYGIDGVMPDDYRDYLDSFYVGSTSSTTSVYLPTVSERGSLSLKIAGQDDGETLTLQEIYTKCTPSVVYVMAEQKDGSGYSWGTGIIVSADGYIITNTHVIADCVNAEIGLTDGSTYEAKLVGYDSVSDIAILKIDATGLTPAVFAESSTVSVGDTAVAIGNPLGESYRLTMTDGIISAKDRSVNHNGTVMNLLQTNAAINEGNSGGPLFNDKGQVVGITNMKIISAEDGVEGIGFAIPTDTITDIISSIMSEGAVYGRVTIGITVGAIPENIAEYYNIPQGLYISNVEKNSDAAKQGVKAGDILLSVNGKEVTTTQDVADIKNALDIGDTMKFRIWRDGKEITIDVKLMDSTDIFN